VPENDDHYRAMRFEHPRYIPVSVGLLPAVWMRHRENLDALVRRHPTIFGTDQPAHRDYDAIGQPKSRRGEHVDAWGCVWSNLRDGMAAMVTGHPVPTRQAVHSLKAPDEDDGMPHGFMFMRLPDLRGFEQIMVDFAEQPPELQMLIDVVLEYNMRQVERRLAEQAQPGRIVHFGDDLGMQTSLPISPDAWRKYPKGCYAKIYGRVRQAGHYVYMHSDGHIFEVIGDLVDCGVNVINPQIRANGLDNLVATCKGKVCVDLDLDRQLFPFCSLADIDAHVHEAVEKLGAPEGGLWLKAECGPELSIETIEAICNALETYRGYFTQ